MDPDHILSGFLKFFEPFFNVDHFYSQILFWNLSFNWFLSVYKKSTQLAQSSKIKAQRTKTEEGPKSRRPKPIDLNIHQVYRSIRQEKAFQEHSCYFYDKSQACIWWRITYSLFNMGKRSFAKFCLSKKFLPLLFLGLVVSYVNTNVTVTV